MKTTSAGNCSRRLRLDAFADEPPSLFDAVAANMALIRKIA